MSLIQIVLSILLIIQLVGAFSSIKLKLFTSFLLSILASLTLLLNELFNVNTTDKIFFIVILSLYTIFLIFTVFKVGFKSKLLFPEDWFSAFSLLVAITLYIGFLWFNRNLQFDTLLNKLPVFIFLAFPFSIQQFFYLSGKQEKGVFERNRILEIAGLRTIAIERFFVASTGIFELRHFTHRKTLAQARLEQVLGNIFLVFQPEAARCFIYKESDELKFESLIENKYIKAVDAEGNIFELTTREYTSDELHPIFNYFLIKNQELVASIALIDKFKVSAEEFVVWANKMEFNTVLFNNNLEFNKEQLDDYSIFDKIYSIPVAENQKLLEQLNKKAPTVKISGTNDDYTIQLVNHQELKLKHLDDWKALVKEAINYITNIKDIIWVYRILQIILMMSVFGNYSLVPASILTVAYIFSIVFIQKLKFKWKI
jgi:hypothetical protein